MFGVYGAEMTHHVAALTLLLCVSACADDSTAGDETSDEHILAGVI